MSDVGDKTQAELDVFFRRLFTAAIRGSRSHKQRTEYKMLLESSSHPIPSSRSGHLMTICRRCKMISFDRLGDGFYIAKRKGKP